MAYTAQTITDLTSEASFFEAVQTFFQNNGFTVVENFSSNTGYFTVSVGNMQIKALNIGGTPNGNYQIGFRVYAKFLNQETIEIASSTLSYAADRVPPSSGAERAIQVLLAKKGNAVVFNAASYNENAGKGSFTALTVRGTDESSNLYNIVGGVLGGSSEALYITESNSRCVLSPCHTYPKAEGELFLDPELPVLSNANNAFLFNISDITGLGGAETKHFYKDAANNRYYCIKSNVAIKLEE